MALKYVRDSLPWLVPSAAIVFGASVFLYTNTNEVPQAKGAAGNVAPATATDTTVSALSALSATDPGQDVTRQSASVSLLNPVAPRATPEGTTQALAPLPTPTPKPEVQTTEQRTAALTATQPATSFFNTSQFAAEARAQCMDDLKNLANQARVYFPSGGLTADAAGIEQGRLIGLVAQNCPDVRIRVEGHSDPSGDPAANLRLSQQRAEAVIKRIGAAGVDTSMFEAAGMGDRRPSNASGPESRAYYDRRVEFTVVEEVVQASLRAPAQVQPWAGASCVTELQTAVDATALFYAPRSVSLSGQDLETAMTLANLAMACPHARLRVIGHHTADIQARESVKTGLLRAKALMAMLVGRGVSADQIIIAAPSRPMGIADQMGLPGSRVNFDLILEEG